MSSVDEYDAYSSSLNSNHHAPIAPSGPPDPHKTPDRPRPLGCPPRQKNVRTGDRITLTDDKEVTRPIDMPIMYTVNGSHNDAEKVIAEVRYPQLGKEAKGWMVGPMPEEPFLDRFLPYNTPGTPTRPPKQNLQGHGSTNNACSDTSPTGGGFASMQFPAQSEKSLYGPLCSGLNEGCDSHFFFVHTSEHLDPESRVKPDICLYRDDVVKRFERTDEKTKKKYYLPDLGACDVFCEVKKKEEDDPCDDAFESGKAESPPGPLSEQPKGKPVGKPKTFIKTVDGKRAQGALDDTTGQFTAYAIAILTRQYRTHCFCIGVFGSMARFFRWDRAGVVISRAFNYKEKPWLTEFVKRYCQATDSQRGYDESVCKATVDEEMKFEEKIREHVMDLYAPKDERAVKELLERHYEESKVFKVRIWPQDPKKFNVSHDVDKQRVTNQEHEDMEYALAMQIFPTDVTPVTNEDDAFDDIAEARLALESIGQNQVTGELATKKIRKSVCRRYVEAGEYQYFLVSRPVTVALSIAGRSTRGYWAVKMPNERAGDEHDDYRICFLKDTWRMDTEHTGMEKEGDVMVELYEAGVDYISDIFCHSDVGVSEDGPLSESTHETETNKCAKEEWSSKELKYTSGKHTHYRMVSVNVGCLLRELLGAYELLEATRMAFIAILQALVKCGRLHGDISINNILITRKNGSFVAGILIDWEFSCMLNGEEGRQYSRSGTWAFMSIDILNNPSNHIRGLRDDMESLYYVVLFSGNRWLPHNEVKNLGQEMDNYFYDRKNNGEESHGGAEKSLNIDKGRFTNLFQWADKATGIWMAGSRALQKLQRSNKKMWIPKRFMKVWTEALSHNPSKVDRFEHVVKLNGRNITSMVFAATTTASLFSCPVSNVSQKMYESLKFSNPRSSRSLKRDFEQAQREGVESVSAKDRAYIEEIDNMSPASKRSRPEPETPNMPELDAENNVFLE